MKFRRLSGKRRVLRILVFQGNRAATDGRNARGSTRPGRGPGEDKLRQKSVEGSGIFSELLKSAMGVVSENPSPSRECLVCSRNRTSIVYEYTPERFPQMMVLLVDQREN